MKEVQNSKKDLFPERAPIQYTCDFHEDKTTRETLGEFQKNYAKIKRFYACFCNLKAIKS